MSSVHLDMYNLRLSKNFYFIFRTVKPRSQFIFLSCCRSIMVTFSSFKSSNKPECLQILYQYLSFYRNEKLNGTNSPIGLRLLFFLFLFVRNKTLLTAACCVVVNPRDQWVVGDDAVPLGRHQYNSISLFSTSGRYRNKDPRYLTPLPGGSGGQLGTTKQLDKTYYLDGQSRTIVVLLFTEQLLSFICLILNFLLMTAAPEGPALKHFCLFLLGTLGFRQFNSLD